MEMVFKTKFTSQGMVFGRFWGGGKGSYAAKKLKAFTLEEIMNSANEMLKNGSLDDGMGFEKLTGAILEITKHTTMTYQNKDWVSTDTELEFIGELSDEEKDFLLENYTLSIL